MRYKSYKRQKDVTLPTVWGLVRAERGECGIPVDSTAADLTAAERDCLFSAVRISKRLAQQQVTTSAIEIEIGRYTARGRRAARTQKYSVEQAIDRLLHLLALWEEELEAELEQARAKATGAAAAGHERMAAFWRAEAHRLATQIAAINTIEI